MKILFTTYLLFGTIFIFCYSQNQNITNNSEHRLMFYNVENYFDAEYDSSIIYNEFTPNGDLYWTNKKYLKKRNSIYKVIVAVGGWKPVALIGLAEVENEYVVKDLINNTPLKKQGYDYVHYESKDFRGIDVALIYHTKSFKVLFSKPLVI
ncbi:MAG: endonuclease, partial [Bacteroidota bacterium]